MQITLEPGGGGAGDWRQDRVETNSWSTFGITQQATYIHLTFLLFTCDSVYNQTAESISVV
jgi:hypothetical protein